MHYPTATADRPTFTTKCSCRAQWSSTSQAHCGSCHRHFGSASGFERHRVKGKCIDPTATRTDSGHPVYRTVQRKNCNTTVYILTHETETP